MLKIVGDICLSDNFFDIGYGVGSSIVNGNNPFSYLDKNKDDVWIGNCECVVSNTSVYTDYRKDCFRISPEIIQSCRFIDYYCVANNHVMQHGGEAYRSTCDNLSSLCRATFGSKEHKTVCFDHQSCKVSVTSFSLRKDEEHYEPLYWSFPELHEIEKEYNLLKSDFKIVYIHWGVEFINYPAIEQIRLAHWLIDLGFDLVIGLHPHVMQGYEIYRGKHIFYSLGNFVFNMAWKNAHYSAVICVDLTTKEISYQYVKIDSSFHPRIIRTSCVPILLRFDYLNGLIGEKLNMEAYIKQSLKGLKQYRTNNRLNFIKNLHKYKFSILRSILLDFFKRRLYL